MGYFRTMMGVAGTLALVGLGGCESSNSQGVLDADNTGLDMGVDAGAERSDADAAALPEIGHGKSTLNIDVDGISREFLVHVPQSVDGSKEVPLVVMIHGTTGSGLKFYNISGWVDKANQEGFIAAFPSALVYCLSQDGNDNGTFEPNEVDIVTKWAAGTLGGEKMPLCTEAQAMSHQKTGDIETHVLRDDVVFISQMLSTLQQNLPIDSKQMYVSGFSNGGEMSGRLLLEMSDVFAAFSMAAGTPPPSEGPVVRQAPVAVTIGELDDEILKAINSTRETPLETFLVPPATQKKWQGLKTLM
jgi:poly(3-hydroxybutyrate) depolymerase